MSVHIGELSSTVSVESDPSSAGLGAKTTSPEQPAEPSARTLRELERRLRTDALRTHARDYAD